MNAQSVCVPSFLWLHLWCVTANGLMVQCLCFTPLPHLPAGWKLRVQNHVHGLLTLPLSSLHLQMPSSRRQLTEVAAATFGCWMKLLLWQWRGSALGFDKHAFCTGATGGITKNFETTREVLAKHFDVKDKGVAPEEAPAVAPVTQVSFAVGLSGRGAHRWFSSAAPLRSEPCGSNQCNSHNLGLTIWLGILLRCLQSCQQQNQSSL